MVLAIPGNSINYLWHAEDKTLSLHSPTLHSFKEAQLTQHLLSLIDKEIEELSPSKTLLKILFPKDIIMETP